MATANTQNNNNSNVSVSSSGSSSGLPSTLYNKSVQPNILNEYSSYTYNLSLSVLDINSFNNATYKRSGAKGPFLAYSASKQPANRVETKYGKFDFFIEDLKIEHLVGFEKTSGNTNAIGFNFKIIEPYSMGLFFVALQQEARAKKHLNYLDAPLLLTLEFKGHWSPDPGIEWQNDPFLNVVRHFPLKIRLIDMRVSSRGCEYDVSAYPANESAFEKAKVTFTTAVSVKGKDVETMLKTNADKSLEVYLNAKVKDQKTGKLVDNPDQYVIEFPDLPNGSPNPIKKSDMGFELYKGADTPFGKDNLVYENGVYKRGNIEINPKEGVFKFAQGTDIINAINQIILMSEYGRTALKNVSADGFVNWWRIEARLNYIDKVENLATTGVLPKKYIYRVVPYRVSSAHFLPPNERLKGADIDKKLVVKEYEYIYSGKNTDILDFDINFKTGFYTAIHADGNQNNDDKITQEKTGKAVDPVKIENPIQVARGQQAIGEGQNPTQQQYSSTGSRSSNQGGGGQEDAATLAARQFHDAITSGVDMINVEMTILGDPYYISDSGVGNYNANATANQYINSDGNMQWDTGEVHVLLNFKTPVDINLDTGLYDFGNTYKVMQFSGLYRVLRLQSMFSQGKFTQTLKILRLRGQEAVAGSGNLSVSPEEVEIAALLARPGELRTADEIRASRSLGDFAG